MDWISEHIAIGNIEDAMDTAGLLKAGITAIICLNGFPQTARFNIDAWHEVSLIDGEGNSPEDILRAVDLLEQLSRSHKVLVHCSEGVSRSPFVVACYLARKQKKQIVATIREVAKKRPVTKIDAGLLTMAEYLESSVYSSNRLLLAPERQFHRS